MQPVIEQAQLSCEEWLEGLARICWPIYARCSEQGNPLAITELGSNEAASIAAFEVYRGAASDEHHTRGSTLRVRMVDQLKALNCTARRPATLPNNEKWSVLRAPQKLLR